MTANHPDKLKVRQHMAERAKSKEPPPTPERTREILGWGLIEGERESQLQQTTRGI